MKTLSVIALATAAALLFSGVAQAGCGDVSNLRAPFQMASGPVLPSADALYLPQDHLDAASHIAPSIVGMWRFQFISQGNTSHNPSIPDGAQLDFGYNQWHSDGTEITNSGSRAPATQNFCLGVWRQTAFATYQLNHLALSYDATTGNLNGKVKIGMMVTVSADGNSYAGTFTIDAYDPNGSPVDHVQGSVQATRVTVDTAMP